MNEFKQYIFSSHDKQFRLTLDALQVHDLQIYCQQAGDKETGGILIGCYSEQLDCAYIKMVTGPPADSKSGRTWFQRGTKGLQRLLNKCWSQKRQFYLGEWHFHPFAHPNPSPRDKSELGLIAKSVNYNCPEPLLLIVGGDPNKFTTMRSFVVSKGVFIELSQLP